VQPDLEQRANARIASDNLRDCRQPRPLNQNGRPGQGQRQRRGTAATVIDARSASNEVRGTRAHAAGAAVERLFEPRRPVEIRDDDCKGRGLQSAGPEAGVRFSLATLLGGCTEAS
jgi:hypothetical protein